MGFAVNINQVVRFQASCAEPPCHWQGPERNHHGEAESDADLHTRDHYTAWENYQKAIEDAPPDTYVEYFDDLTIPAEPRSYWPYTGDMPRFAYDPLPHRLVAKSGG